MTNKDFHKSMGNYLDVKRNGSKRSSRRKQSVREPLLRQVGVVVRQIMRTFRIFIRRVKAFCGADHELDLNSLHQDVFVIERDEKRSTVFWRQLKTLFRANTPEKKTPTVMSNHLFDRRERLQNKKNPAPTAQPDDIDTEKINNIIKNNSL